MQYRHPKFKPGTMVYISPTIREQYPLCPLADQTVKVAGANVTISDFLYHKSQREVPVLFERVTWYVEEEYVRPLYSRSELVHGC